MSGLAVLVSLKPLNPKNEGIWIHSIKASSRSDRIMPGDPAPSVPTRPRPSKHNFKQAVSYTLHYMKSTRRFIHLAVFVQEQQRNPELSESSVWHTEIDEMLAQHGNDNNRRTPSNALS